MNFKTTPAYSFSLSKKLEIEKREEELNKKKEEIEEYEKEIKNRENQIQIKEKEINGNYEENTGEDFIRVITLKKIKSDNEISNIVARNVTGKYVYENRKV